MKFKAFPVYLSFLFSFNLYAQELKIFLLNPVYKNETKAFTSLSDIYPLNEHDSLAFPDMSNKGKENTKQYEYIKLSSTYRNRFLSKTNISETDKVFIYSYSKNLLVSLPVSSLNAVAYLNIYTPPEECPCPQYYYQIGFEIDMQLLKGFENYFTNTLVYIGKKSPFVMNQVKPVVWQKIEPDSFPTDILKSRKIDGYKEGQYEIKTHTYEGEKFQYFTQELFTGYSERINAIRLLVIDRISKENVFETIYNTGEGTSIAPLDNQWTGNLFKNKPPVIFGFQFHSFGCPTITFIDPKEKELNINCDNRH